MIRIYEVGPRDGLQNEARILSVAEKLEMIDGLLLAGIRDIEVGAFVRPDRIPQMADTEEIYRSDQMKGWREQYPDARFWSLVPNQKGLDRALACGARNIAIFGAATETFVGKNIGMTIDESLRVFSSVTERAHAEGMEVRSYVSVCWVCPYEGDVDPEAVARVVHSLMDMDVTQVSLGDTIGAAHPLTAERLLIRLLSFAPAERLAVHFHDTYGMAIANIERALRLGISVIDSSIGGLGGCPYAAGASGNVATEDVYTLLEGEDDFGFHVDPIDIRQLLATSARAQEMVGHTLPSKRLAAFLRQSRSS